MPALYPARPCTPAHLMPALYPARPCTPRSKDCPVRHISQTHPLINRPLELKISAHPQWPWSQTLVLTELTTAAPTARPLIPRPSQVHKLKIKLGIDAYDNLDSI